MAPGDQKYSRRTKLTELCLDLTLATAITLSGAAYMLAHAMRTARNRCYGK